MVARFTAAARWPIAWRAGWRPAAARRERAVASCSSSRARGGWVRPAPGTQPAVGRASRALRELLPPAAARQRRAGRVLRGRAVGLRRPRRADAHRRAQRRQARSAAPPVRPGAGPRAALGALAGAQHAWAGTRADLRALRPRQRAVLAVPGPDDDVLLRGLRVAAVDARGGVAGQARARLREARARPAGSRARDRHGLGRLCRLRGRALRLSRHDDDDLRRAARIRDAARARGRAAGSCDRAARRTTATSTACTTSSSRSR